MTENFKKILLIPALILISAWILFNPYVCYADSEFILSFSLLINDFCKNISLNYRFSNVEILNLLRFLEYFIFGIFSAAVYKMCFKRNWSNMANPLFLGLIVAVTEIYLKSLGIQKLQINDVLISFFEFCAGLLIVLIFCLPKSKKIFSSKYKKNRYIGRS